MAFPWWSLYESCKGGGGGERFFFCGCIEETGRVKNCLGECSLKVTRPDGECSKILVSNPAVGTNNWRAACNKLVSDFLGRIFFLVQMSSIFACDLGLNRKTLSRNFFCCFVFRFREIFFNQHWRQMRASLILLFGKTKAFFGKDTARKKTAFLHTLFVENERETSKLKWGAMFFYKVEGHMPKLSSFGRGKKFRPKKSLTSLLHAALQSVPTAGLETKKINK